jgi:hypothetical protein
LATPLAVELSLSLLKPRKQLEEWFQSKCPVHAFDLAPTTHAPAALIDSKIRVSNDFCQTPLLFALQVQTFIVCQRVAKPE